MWNGQFEYVKYKPERKAWVSYIHKQIYRKNNCLFGAIVGKPGSGKSWGALSFACLINPDFELAGNFYFSPSEMFRDIGKYYADNGPRKKGKIWILDEAGVGISNMDYHSEINRGYGIFYQTARHRNPISLLTVPRMGLIDSKVRKLMTAQWTAIGFNGSRKKTIIKPRLIEYNDDLDKFYYKMLRMLKDNRMFAIDKMELPMPPIHIVKEYEKIKSNYTRDLFMNVSAKLDRYEEKEKKKYDSVLTYSTQQNEVLNLLKKKFDVNNIASHLEIVPKVVYDYMKALRGKGVTIIPHRCENNKVDYYEVVDPKEVAETKTEEKLNTIINTGPPIPNSS